MSGKLHSLFSPVARKKINCTMPKHAWGCTSLLIVNQAGVSGRMSVVPGKAGIIFRNTAAGALVIKVKGLFFDFIYYCFCVYWLFSRSHTPFISFPHSMFHR